jgi:hypothetical protein
MVGGRFSNFLLVINNLPCWASDKTSQQYRSYKRIVFSLMAPTSVNFKAEIITLDDYLSKIRQFIDNRRGRERRVVVRVLCYDLDSFKKAPQAHAAGSFRPISQRIRNEND